MTITEVLRIAFYKAQPVSSAPSPRLRIT